MRTTERLKWVALQSKLVAAVEWGVRRRLAGALRNGLLSPPAEDHAEKEGQEKEEGDLLLLFGAAHCMLTKEGKQFPTFALLEQSQL